MDFNEKQLNPLYKMAYYFRKSIKLKSIEQDLFRVI